MSDTVGPLPESPQAKAALRRQGAQLSLIDFVRAVAPWYILDAVHITILRHLEHLYNGEFDRLMIHTAPRTGKSKAVSVFFRAWVIGKDPSIKLINASHTSPLAEGFADETLALMASDAYREVFPHVRVVRSAVKSFTFKDVENPQIELGQSWSVGALNRIAGKGANIATLDDILSEQDYMSDTIKNKLFSWYRDGLYTRLQLEWSRILIMATRWCYDDPPGRIMELAEETDEEWEVLSVPAILDRKSYLEMRDVALTDQVWRRDKTKPKLRVGDSFMPTRMSLEQIHRAQTTVSNFEAQYMQRPANDEGAIFKRQMFHHWPEEKPCPELEHLISFYDTAFEEKEMNSYTARVTAAVYTAKMVDPRTHAEHMARKMLIFEADQQHMQAADLYEEAIDNDDHWRKQGQHLTVIEKKASGIQLVQELKRARRPVVGWLPKELRIGTRDKISRANAAVIHVSLGDVALWWEGDWQDTFLDEVTGFPLRQHDDMADAFSMAVLFFRRHYLMNIPFDYESDEELAAMGMEQPMEFGEERRVGYGRL